MQIGRVAAGKRVQQPLEAAALGEPRAVEIILVDKLAPLPRAGTAHVAGAWGVRECKPITPGPHGLKKGHDNMGSD